VRTRLRAADDWSGSLICTKPPRPLSPVALSYRRRRRLLRLRDTAVAVLFCTALAVALAIAGTR